MPSDTTVAVLAWTAGEVWLILSASVTTSDVEA
jgi:hypothetical protein